MKVLHAFAVGLVVSFLAATQAAAQSWTPLVHQPSFNASTALLLTDGTVMVQAIQSSAWWRLSPDNTGSYVRGTWTQLASMPAGYAPLYYASAVLADGRVIVEGGEYNAGSVAETALGAIYDPAVNAWAPVAPPNGWNYIGDAQSAVLANGDFMLGNCGFAGSVCTNQLQQARWNTSILTPTWSLTGAGKADQNSEEGWTLLPGGKLLVVDVWNGTQSEIYDPNTGSWALAGSTGVPLVNAACGEVGPAVLLPNGSVFATGGTSATAFYNPGSGQWQAGPTFPTGIGVNDGPAALLPNGHVLVQAGPTQPCFAAGSQFFELVGSTLVPVAGPPRAALDPSYAGRMLVLPTGQVLFTDGSADVEVYTPAGTYNFVWQPTLNSYPTNLTIGASWYSITGTQFNGLSQGASYGDDAQMATNYPLVRITNSATGHVFYAKTHHHSSMGVATAGVEISTLFDPPLNTERGLSTLVVVANGIPSAPVAVMVW